MAKPKPTSFRFSPELLKNLDGYTARLSQEAGVHISRNRAIEKLLTDAVRAAMAQPALSLPSGILTNWGMGLSPAALAQSPRVHLPRQSRRRTRT